MCGLAGFVRNPKKGSADDLEMSKMILEELLLRNQSRGAHATGVAFMQQDGSTETFKLAMPAKKVIALKGWREMLAGQTGTLAVAQGHTRHATQNNAHVDACAHPFTFGEVTGAHNGMIYNWRELEREIKPGRAWSVDSEAAFHLLEEHGDPQKMLNMIDGYWALTWTKKGKLYMVKTPDAKLATAYVPSMQTLFWSSERAVLESVLKGAKLLYEAWELHPGRLYTLNPTQLEPDSANAKKRDVSFKARRKAENATWRTEGPRSTVRVLPKAPYDNYSANNRNLPSYTEQLSMGLSAEERTMWQAIRDLERMVKDQQGTIETLQAEVEFLQGVVQEGGLLDGDSQEEDFFLGTCEECEGAADDGEHLETPTGWVHSHCVLPKECGTPYLEQENVA